MAESARKKTGPGNNGKDLAMAAPSVQGLCHNTTNRIRASITRSKKEFVQVFALVKTKTQKGRTILAGGSRE
jgi:hypothetical protein